MAAQEDGVSKIENGRISAHDGYSPSLSDSVRYIGNRKMIFEGYRPVSNGKPVSPPKVVVNQPTSVQPPKK